MAQKGIDLSIAADNRSAQSAITRGIIEPLEDVSELIETIGPDSDRMTDQLEKGMREAQHRTEDAADEIRQLRDEVNKAGRGTKDLGDGGAMAFGHMNEAAQEVTQEVGQNLGQAVSSFRGDIQDLGQIGQDTLGGLAATIAGSGPAGIAGAAVIAAGAAGLGLITAEIEKENERIKQLKQYFSEAWKSAIEGGNDYLATADIIAETQDLMLNPERADEWKKTQEDAKKLMIDAHTLATAMFGDEKAQQEVKVAGLALLDREGKKLKEISDSTETRVRGVNTEYVKQEQVAISAEKLVKKYQDMIDVSDQAKASAADYTQWQSEYLLGLIEDAGKASETVDKLGNKMVELPDGTTVYIDADTGQASLELDKFEEDADAVVKRVNSSKIVLEAQAQMDEAQRQINRFVASVDGKSFRLHGRVTVDGGWD